MTEIDPRIACIYSGRVRHRRFSPKLHDFSYGLYMTYLELDRLEEILDGVGCASARGRALVSYRREDYFGDSGETLSTTIRNLVAERTGRRPEGPVRMLTHLRTWGVSFNPVSFYYCFDPSGERVEHIVAEINNTPWGERYTYVLSDPTERKEFAAKENARKTRPQQVSTFHTGKDFHVSPFIDMDVRYVWKLTDPGESLFVHMEDLPLKDSSGSKIFDATLSLNQRLPLSTKNLLWSQARHPAMPAMVMIWIYRQALGLWLKKVPFYSHPRKSGPQASIAADGVSGSVEPASSVESRSKDETVVHPSDQ